MPFAIGIENYQKDVNVGSLLRSAYCFGASMVFTIGRRYKHQSPDTTKTSRHIPLMCFESWDDYLKNPVRQWMHIAIENVNNAGLIRSFVHPKSAVYVLGSEGNGLSGRALDICKYVVEIPTAQCLNVATTGAIIMFDRNNKMSEKCCDERREK